MTSINPNTKITRKLINEVIKKRAVRMAVTKESHLWFFSVYFNHHMTHAMAPFHKEIFALTEDEKTKLSIVIAFRGSGKTTIMNQSYPIWAVLGKQQKKYVLLLAQTMPQARQILKNIKYELETNELLRSDLGPFVDDDDWNAYSIIIPRYGARITAASREQSIRGTKHGAHRPDLVILDDVEDLASTRTKESRDATYQWVVGDIFPIGSQRTKMVCIGNLLHGDSLLMRLKKEIESGKRNGVCKTYPIVDEHDRPLWTAMYPDFAAVQAKNMEIGDDRAFQREYCLRIIATDDQVIKEEWIQYYDEIPAAYRDTQTGIDLAITEKDSSDYTAMVSGRIVGYHDKLRIYVLPNPINERMKFPETLDKAKALSMALGNGRKTVLIIEGVGYQPALVQQLQREGFPAKEFQVHGQDKASRLRLASFLVQSGHVLFPRKGTEALIAQLVGFPSERHDDLVDAFAILVLHAMQERRGAFGIMIPRDDSDLNHLNSRAKAIEIEKRERIRNFFLL